MLDTWTRYEHHRKKGAPNRKKKFISLQVLERFGLFLDKWFLMLTRGSLWMDLKPVLKPLTSTGIVLFKKEFSQKHLAYFLMNRVLKPTGDSLKPGLGSGFKTCLKTCGAVWRRKELILTSRKKEINQSKALVIQWHLLCALTEGGKKKKTPRW